MTGLGRQGDAKVQFNMGRCLVNGKGVEKNLAEAYRMFRKAALQGHAGAQNSLGGRGVAKNLVQAFEWCHKAAMKGCPEAQFNVGDWHSRGFGCEQSEVIALEWFDKAAAQGDEEAHGRAEALRKLLHKV